MSKTLRLNVNYIILFKIPKNQLSQIYIDQPININKELFYKIISELNKYENIIIQKSFKKAADSAQPGKRALIDQ